MPRKRHKPEEIVAQLRQVDLLVSQGQSVADADLRKWPRLQPRLPGDQPPPVQTGIVRACATWIWFHVGLIVTSFMQTCFGSPARNTTSAPQSSG